MNTKRKPKIIPNDIVKIVYASDFIGSACSIYIQTYQNSIIAHNINLSELNSAKSSAKPQVCGFVVTCIKVIYLICSMYRKSRTHCFIIYLWLSHLATENIPTVQALQCLIGMHNTYSSELIMHFIFKETKAEKSTSQ